MDKKFFALVGVIFVGVLMRWLPHPPNFSPVASIALFSGAYLASKKLSLVLPLVIMALSDLVLGFSSITPVIYACFLITTILGWQLRERQNLGLIAAQSLAAAVIFFVVTNTAVWLLEPWYAKNASGLLTCFAMAIPFFAYSVIGNLLFSFVLFAGWAFAEKKFFSYSR